MFRRILPSVTLIGNSRIVGCKSSISHRAYRQFSVLSIHSTFPASLLRYSPTRQSALYDYAQYREEYDMDDGVKVSKDGLVYPMASNALPSASNGAIFMPNTFTMQELVRRCVDQYMDDLENGKHLEAPLVYCVPKGTPIPSSLILTRLYISQFSLQPALPMQISDLNAALDEFYSQYAIKKTAEQWLDEHNFDSANADDAESIWMAK